MIEYYSAIKKKKILPFVVMWMYLVYIMLSEISQTEKDKYCMISLICEILKSETYKNKEKMVLIMSRQD